LTRLSQRGFEHEEHIFLLQVKQILAVVLQFGHERVIKPLSGDLHFSTSSKQVDTRGLILLVQSGQ